MAKNFNGTQINNSATIVEKQALKLPTAEIRL